MHDLGMSVDRQDQALAGVITDPRELEQRYAIAYPKVVEPDAPLLDTADLVAPPSPEESRDVELRKGPNIATLPDFEPLPDELELPVLLTMGDDISTDEILRAGAEVLPYRSNIPEIATFAFDVIDDTYHDRAVEVREGGGHAVVGGRNYGQGSSREHAALAPRFLGLRVVIAQAFARIHWQNLANFGILPLTFDDPDDLERIERGTTLVLSGLHEALQSEHQRLEVVDRGAERTFVVRHDLSSRQVERILSGGVIRFMKQKLSNEEVDASGRDTLELN